MVHRELKADALWQHRGVGWGGIGGVSRGMEHETSCSGLGHWDDPEEWDGEGGGTGVQDGEHMYTRG